MEGARRDMAEAQKLSKGLGPQARGSLAIFDHMIGGRPAEAFAAVRAHLMDYPRDALVAQSCLGVFSLIGFSGRMGREAEHLALAEMLAPHYGEDPWFLAQIAFAQLEVGQLGAAAGNIDASIAARPRSAYAAHIRAHLYYEEGRTADGLRYLSDWIASYPRDGMMHCHNSWHCALWAMASGDEAEMWRIADEDLAPEASKSPALNILTDLASLYHRAEMAGVSVPQERWRKLSAYAAQAFPNTGLGFADFHAALAHAMAGEVEPLERIARGAKGPVADLVAPCATGFGAMARGAWAEAEAALVPVVAGHERLGGSRAQRDMLEFSLMQVLLRQGKGDEAARLLRLRRPRIDASGAVAGI